MLDAADQQQRAGRDGFRVGAFTVDVPALRLLHGDHDLAAEALQVRTLICLADAWPGIVSKSDLIDGVWAGRPVSDAAVHKTISLLRRQLRELAGEEYILTRHRLGYQLAFAPSQLAPGEPATASGPGSMAPPAPAAGNGPRSRSPRWLPPTALALLLLAAAGWLAVGLLPSRPEPVAIQPDLAPEPRTDLPAPPGYAGAELAGLSDQALLELLQDAFPANPGLAREAAAAASQRPALVESPQALALVHKQLGRVARHEGALQLAAEHFAHSLALFTAANDRTEMANAHSNLAVVLDESQGPAAAVLDHYAAAEALWLALDDAAGQARLANNRAGFLLRQARYQEARIDLQRLRDLALALQDPEAEARAWLLEADIAIRAPGSGDPEPALVRALELAERAGSAQMAAAAAQRLGRLAEIAGRPEQERALLERARVHLLSAGMHGQVLVIDYGIAASFEREGLDDQALSAYLALLSRWPDGGPAAMRVDTLVNIARVGARLGHHEQARAWLQEADASARVLGQPAALASALVERGMMELSHGSAVLAAALASEAESLVEPHWTWQQQANVLRLAILSRLAVGASEDGLARAIAFEQAAIDHADQRLSAEAAGLRSLALMASGRFPEAYPAFLEHQHRLAHLAGGLRVAEAPTVGVDAAELAADRLPATVAAGPTGRIRFAATFCFLLGLALGAAVAGWRSSQRRARALPERAMPA